MFSRLGQTISSVAVGVCLMFGMLLCGTVTTYGVTNLVWSDEFNGSSSNVDVTKWNFDIGNSSTIAGGGWGNQEKETYSSRTNNAFVANGLLHIVTINDQGGGAPYSSARLQTLRKFSMTYGRAEFRAKLPGNGLYWWPALWMLATNFAGGTNPTNHWPQCGEIDVCESKGSTPGDVLGTLHKDSSGSPGNDSANGGQYNFPAGDGTTNFHTYVLSWVSNSISFSVDNNAPYKTITSWSSSIGPYPTPFNHPFYIIMNLAVGGTFFSDNPSVATINANDTFPAEMDIDYVRVYQDVPPLLATGVSPTNGCMNGGTPITISGSNFLSGATVTIGGVPATSVVFVNTNTLTAVTPANPAGPMNVAVQMQYISPTGTNTLTATLTNAFTYIPGPSFGGLTSATPGTNGATLTWSAASGTAPITYEVFEATSSGAENYASPVLVTNVTSVLVAPLSCSNTYFFVVRAVDGCGNTDGNTVEQSAPLSSGPAFAGLGSVIPATEAATLSWSAASGAPPVAYNVYEATASGTEDYGSPVLTTNSLSAFIAPLYPGSNSPITYFFVARAVDACNNSDTNTVERSIQPLLDPAKSQVNDGIPNGWKQQYGLNPFDPSVAAADPDGDGLSNLQEYLLGTDPTDKSSPFHVIAITQENNDLLITWADAAGRTNVVEAASDVGGTYSNISDNIIVPGTSLGITNYLDAGAVTNSLSRFYRVRVVP